MTINEVIKALEALRDEHGGDYDVAIDDADTDWLLKVQRVYWEPGTFCAALRGEYAERVLKARE